MRFHVSNLLILSLMVPLLSACGSRPSDFPDTVEVKNPLPPCPDSPNCIRTTRAYADSIDIVWNAMVSTLERMKPYDVEINADEYRIDAVFLVVFFRDDLVVKLEAPEKAGAEKEETYLHIRSSSRIGSADFGVNRKRVKEFFDLMEEEKEF